MSAFQDAALELNDLKTRVAELEAAVAALRALAPSEPTDLKRTAYKISEVAQLLGVNRQTVNRWILDEKLPAVDMGGWWAVRREVVERLLNTHGRRSA